MKKLLTLLAFVTVFSSPLLAQEKTNDSNQKQTAKKTALTKEDNLQIAVQKICPVMGEKLGSMGQPIKVQADGQTLYLCCKGCVGKELNKKHWATVLSNLAKAQKTCPIMDKPVDGKMESVVVKGKRIFVCCPPCIDKIQEKPDDAIKKVRKNYLVSVRAERQAINDKIQVAAQKICPVTGQKLGSMGNPVKVKVGKEHVFLCCKGCQKKQLDPTHWKTVQANLAKAQGVCPVMGHEVDETSESVVVGGRRIFVCCPPCIDKIKAEPAKHIRMLNAQILNGGKAKEKKKE